MINQYQKSLLLIFLLFSTILLGKNKKTLIEAQDDIYTVTYSTESQLVGSVYDNDRYGTATPTDKEVRFLKLSSSVDNNGKYISTIRGGMLRLPAGLAVGRHYVYYKIRDIKDITHFATATATVIVLPQTTTPTTSTSTTTPTTTTSTTITLTAQDDTYTVTYSTESQLVGSVYDNDRYGTATPTDKEVLFSYIHRSTDNNGKYISTVRGGMLRLPAGLSVGRHYIYYKIRDIKNVTNFATAIATVIVLPQTTTPTTETPTTSTATTTPTTTTLTAQDDTYTVTYSTEPQTVGSVYDNDRYGTATPTDKEVQFSYVRRNTDNNGKYISTIRGGMLHLPAGLAEGRHYVYYKIRDIKDITHFATATATVIVLPQTTTPTTSTSTTTTSTTTATTTPTTTTLTAQDDTYTVTYSTESQIVGSVYDNDCYGTATPTDKEVQFSYVRRSTDDNGKYISTTQGGMLRLPAGLSVGCHYVYYKIRDIKDATHFATATATVIVLPQTTTPTTETPTTSTATTTPTTTTLTAQDDTYTVTYSTESQLVGSVYDNDRYGKATPTDKEVQFSYIHRSTDNNGKYISTTRGGMLLLPAGLAEGRHYVYYKIRDIKDITHFATATATVIVLPQTTTPTTETPTTSTATTIPTTTTSTTITLTAQDDTYTVTYSTESQLVGSVYDNDRYGTATPTDKEVQFLKLNSSVDNNGKYISTRRGGMLHLPADLAVGRHYVYYKIRDIKDATHFATATATVIVLPTTTTPTTSTSTTTPTTTTNTTITLTAQDDTYTITYSTEPQLVGSVYDNDRYGTATPTDKEVQFSYVRRSTDNNGKYISTVRGGMLRLPTGLAVGRHYIYYKIRDIKDATHSATATATVIVLPKTTTPTTSTSTTTTSTTTSTTTPTTTTLTAQDDTYTVTYSADPQTIGSVYDNDRYGTATPTDKEVQFSYVRRSTDNNGKFISIGRGGMLSLPAGLAVGRHYVYYKIRDIKDVTHFATATATVIVLPQTTTPTTSTSTTTPTTTTSTTITLTAQDDTYTVTYSTESQLVGSVYDNDHYGTATPTDKEVHFSYVRRSTDDNGKYISTTRGGMLRLPAALSVGHHYVYYKIRDIKDITHFATATATVIVLPQTTTPTTETPTTSTATTTPTTTTLTAQDDTYTVTYSIDPQLVGSVYDNDRYGTATPTDKEVQFSYVRRSTDNNGKYISTIRGGMLSLPAGLAVGRHYVYYKIRDIKDATHSATATATVIVLLQTTTPTTETPTTSTATTTPTTTTSTTITLTAQDDTYTVTYSAESQLVGSVYDNDHYGTATPTDKEVQFSYVRRSTDDNGKYISTVRGGMLRLPAGLAEGRHYVYYKIRDIKDITHFATATATVIVLPQTTTPTTEPPTTSTSTTTPTTTTSTTITLTAQDDTYTVTYSNEPQIVGSVYDNDRYGTATPTDKEVQFSYVRRSTDNNGKYISTVRGGMLRLPAGLSVGHHYVYYKIRDIKDVTNFATATATVIVQPQITTPTTETPTTSTSTTTSTTITLTAQDDTYTVTYSTESQIVGSVYDNDRYGTQTPTDKDVQFSYVRRSTDNNGKYISTTRDGMLRLPGGLSVGRHYVHYKIRDIKDVTHFATATATVIVLPQTTTPTTSTSTTTPTTTTNTTITLTAQDDTYTVTYSTELQIVGSVYDNDRYGTATPTDKEVQFSYVRRSTDDNGKYISTGRGGMLHLPAGLSVGHHYVYYKIRDIKDVTHFATATATVIVLPQTTTPTTSTSTTTPTTETPTTSTATTTPTTTTLIAQDDTYTVTYNTEPQLVGSVYDNDHYGTATPTDKEVQFLKLSSSVDNNGKYISTTRGGMLRLPAGLSVGRHYVYYKIRDIKNVTHFATATATVIVLLQTTTPTTETPTTSTATTTPTTTTSTTITLTAQDDTYTVTYSTESQLVGSVYDNDHYDTATPTDKEVQFSYVRRSTDDNGKYISTVQGGMLRLPAGLAVGRHYIYYKIRDIKDATHFATATATVIVLPQTTTPTTETPTTTTSTTTSTTITLTAQDDTYTITYSSEPQIVGSVYDNDRYGTQTPTDKEVQFSYIHRSTDNNGKYISTAQGGMLRLPAGLSVGRHYVYYKIRDIKDATHFATATATVIVLPQTTTPTTETPTTTTSTTTPTTTTSTTTTLTAQDDTYTVTYSNEPQTVGSVYDNDRYGTATPTDKEVQFSYVRRSTDNNGKFISTAQGGMLRLPAGLSVGRHYVYYKIRDIKDITHFATATATVIVLPQTTTPTTETPTISTTTPTTTTLTAQDDTYTVTYSTESQLVGSVYDNDRYGTATPTDKEVQFSYIRRSTDNNGKYISTAQGGMLRVPAGLSVGQHYLLYKIREIQNLKNFAIATATIVVLPKTTTPTTASSTSSTATATTASSTTTATTTPTTTTLTAQDDTYTVTYSNEPQIVGSVYDNDHYGTATPTDKEVQFSYVRRSTDNNGKYISTTRGGILRLPAGLAVGRHYVYYKIRDIKDVTNFATATATVIVLPQTTTPTTETPTTSTATTTPTTIPLTAQDDTYTVTYSNDSQIVGSVYDNDRYGTATPTDKEVQFSYVRRSTDNNGKYISTIRGGILRLPAGLSVGRHYVYYKIRDIKDVTHFATATATVIVLPETTTPTTETPTTSTATTTPTTTTLTAQDDTYTVTYSTEPQIVGSVYDNDRYGTATPTDKEVQFGYVRRSTDNNGKYISTTRGGMLRLPADLAVGRHYIYYKIRDIKDVTHFATATATVIVLPKTTTPTTETPTTEEPLRPIAVADAVTTPMNTPVLIAILQNDIPYDAVPYISAFPYKGSVTLNDSNEVLYTPNNNTTGADSFTYELRSPDAAISLATTTVTVKIWSPITPCTGISANGDGKNDYFHIMGIENYPENTLTIYDSNANEVFSVSHYDNEVCRFEGTNLPQGVYFFVLTYRDEDDNLEQQVGWFYLKK